METDATIQTGSPPGSQHLRCYCSKPLGFAGIFCIIYALLLVGVFSANRQCASFMFSTIGKLGARALPDGVVMILKLDESKCEESFNTILALTTREEAIRTGFGRGGRPEKVTGTVFPHINYFWTPLIFFASLALATPTRFDRKIVCLMAGLALMFVFVFLRFTVSLHELLSTADWLLDHEPGALYTASVKGMQSVLNETQWTSSVIAVLIWLAVCFRRSDWQ